jgi:hypothetical protein
MMRERSTWRQSRRAGESEGREGGRVCKCARIPGGRQNVSNTASIPPVLPLLPPSRPHLDVHVCAPSTGTAACLIEVIADAATRDRVPRHASEARGLVTEEGIEGEEGG